MKDTIWIKKGRFTPLAILLMLALPLTTSVICLCFGRMNVPVGEVLTALRTALTGGNAANVQNYSIVINLRLPRIRPAAATRAENPFPAPPGDGRDGSRPVPAQSPWAELPPGGGSGCSGTLQCG